MLKTILVAYDASESAARAFRFALELAKPLGAAIRVLAVAYPPAAPTAAEMAGLLGSATESLEQAFVDLREVAETDGVSPDMMIRTGNPARLIVDAAIEQNADLIVMGNPGKGWIECWMSRSLSRQVLRGAPCAVAVVK